MMPADLQALGGPGVTQGGWSDFQAGCLNLYAVRHMFFHAAAKTRATHMCKLVDSKLAANGQERAPVSRPTQWAPCLAPSQCAPCKVPSQWAPSKTPNQSMGT